MILQNADGSYRLRAIKAKLQQQRAHIDELDKHLSVHSPRQLRALKNNTNHEYSDELVKSNEESGQGEQK